MKRILASAARAAMMTAALAFAACGSSGGTTGGGTGTADTASASGDAGSDGTAAKADGTTTDNGSATSDGTGTELPKPDAGPDVAKEVAQPKPEYGTCVGVNDQACVSGCAQASCMAEIQGCLGDAVCDKLYKCVGGCQQPTPVMPPQDGTPVAQLPNEATPAYCARVCFLQGGNLAAGKLAQMNFCALGKCLDCDKLSPQLADACKAQCGAHAKCADAQKACASSNDCLQISGCILGCADNACANKCFQSAPAPAQAAYKALDDCAAANKDSCVAPK